VYETSGGTSSVAVVSERFFFIQYIGMTSGHTARIACHYPDLIQLRRQDAVVAVSGAIDNSVVTPMGVLMAAHA
jgi:hypothetical protein